MSAIPGTRRIKYLDENLGAARVELSAEDMQELEGVLAQHEVGRLLHRMGAGKECALPCTWPPAAGATANCAR